MDGTLGNCYFWASLKIPPTWIQLSSKAFNYY